MTRPLAHGYDTRETGVLHGMSGTRQRVTTAVTAGLVTAGLVLSGCASTTVAGTAVSDTAPPTLSTATTTTTRTTTTTAPRPLTFDDRVYAMVDDALEFWRPLTGDPLNDVTVTIYDAARPDDCRAAGGFASVCSNPDGSDPEIAVERDTVRPLTETGDAADDMTLAIFMSHEVGHIVTNRAAGHRVEGLVGEERAECAAGIFITQRGGRYGTVADVEKVAYPRRAKVFAMMSDDAAAVKRATTSMIAAFNVGVKGLTVEDCIRAYPA